MLGDSDSKDSTLRQKLKFLRKRLVAYADDVKAIRDQGRLAKSNEANLDAFFGMYLGLETAYKNFESVHFEMDELCILNDSNVYPSQDDTVFLSEVKKCKHEAAGLYVTLERKRKLEDQAARAFPSNLDTSLNQTVVNVAPTSNLPDISLPTFSGEITEWPFFRDSFLGSVHNKDHISKIDKFTYLVGILKPPALNCIKAIRLSENNYELAWAKLREKYDNQRHLSAAYIHNFLDGKPIQRGTVESLEHFISNIIVAVDSFKALEIENREDYLLFEIVIRYLDQPTRQAFEHQHAGKTHPTFEQLKKFIETRHRELTCSTLGYKSPSTYRTERPHTGLPTKPNRYQPNQATSLYSSNVSTKSSEQRQQKFQCFVCRQPHVLKDCAKFRDAEPKQRVDMLSKWNGCRNCLCPKHRTNQCTSKYNCRQCHARHHSLLHLPTTSDESKTVGLTSKPPETSTGVVNLASIGEPSPKVLLGTALAKVQDCTGSFQDIRMVLDSGSQNSYITSSCAHRLGFALMETDCHISGISNTSVSKPEGTICCTLKPRNSNNLFSTTAFVIPTITPPLPREPVSHLIIEQYLHLDLADPEFGTPGIVDFLLGADLFLQILTNPAHNQPPILNTIFGQVIIGPLGPTSTTTLSLLSTNNIEESLHKFWEVEEIRNPIPLSDEDKQCEEFFRDTTYREPSGRYVVALPFRTTKFNLGPSRSQALSRLYSLENKLSKDTKLRQQYNEFMLEYFQLGHMHPTTSPSSYIIPHHGIFKRDSDKIRVVFDGSSRTAGGSLNDHLLTGPQLQRDITDIVTRFRRHAVVFTADVIKMFRQILVRPSDRRFQHILWRFKPDEPVKTYELITLTYGLTTSPYQAMRVIRQLVEDEGLCYPEASAVLLNDMYVDDIATGAADTASAITLKDHLKELLAKGCFHLSKWACNVPEVIADEHQSSEAPINIAESADNNNANIKILGLQWSPTTDNFSFTVISPSVSSSPNKRSILSTIARLYDPLGFLAPVIFTAKLILQDTWKEKCDWDDPVPAQIKSNWLKFVHGLHLLQNVYIQRYLGDTIQNRCYLLGFCDASERGYCAAVYVSTKDRTSLLKAKTKLAPLKTITVPRLELCGAVLLTKLLHSIKPLLQTFKDHEVLLFTDSMVVLSWLSTPPHILKTFVAHRVVHILEKTEPSWWRHVSSSDNPADCGSRGLLPAELIKHSLWWEGPSWVQLPRHQWPITSEHVRDAKNPDFLLETKSITTSLSATIIAPTENFIQWTERFSNYNRLVRAFAYALRFIGHCRKQTVSTPISEITAAELDLSLTSCVRIIQHHYYPDALNQPPQLSPQLQRLAVYTDSLGLLRVGGRIDKSNLTYDQKHPILLPKDAHFSTLIVKHYHKASLHIGCAALQAIIQRKFWIISLRNLCRKVKRRCLTCRRFSKPSPMPFMGNIPSTRFCEANAFTITAVDFAGPFQVRETPRRKSLIVKVYLCLFVCLSTKAVHLELARGLTTEAFIDVLDKFVARRGRPTRFLSDCGTNFVGTANYYQELCKWLTSQKTQDDINRHSAQLGVNWDFNPPRTPHFGGLFEAAIKSAKTLLLKIVGNSSLTIPELEIAFVKIEAMLNSRPLYPTSDDPDDCQPLTPGHFLIGGPINALPEQDLLETPCNRLSRWQLVRERTQAFWQRWRDEYLGNLMKRNKWYTHTNNLKVGDIVLLKDISSTPCLWPYAKIIQVHPGSDGIVRVATVKTKTGTLKRHIGRLLSLQPLIEEPTVHCHQPPQPID